MATYSGFDYTTFRGVNLKNTAAIRLVSSDGSVGTLSFRPDAEADREWIMPRKSGAIGVMGTFTVDHQAVSATTYTYSTAVTVTGIRAEDGLIVQAQAFDGAPRTARILTHAVPTSDTITLHFVNVGAAQNRGTDTYAYIVYR